MSTLLKLQIKHKKFVNIQIPRKKYMYNKHQILVIQREVT